MLWFGSLMLANIGFIALSEYIRRREPPFKRALLFWILSLLGGLASSAGAFVALVWYIRESSAR